MNSQYRGRLAGKVAVVTGGNTGIGKTICLELAREGAAVAVVAGSKIEEARSVATEIEQMGGRAVATCVDITSRSSVDRLMQEVVDAFSRIDILVNNAGGGGVSANLEDLTEEQWDRAFDLNTKGSFFCSAAAARHMIPQRSGSIINILGASAHRCNPRRGSFGPSKAAVVNLTIQASLEWGQHRIRVNGVSPGPVRDGDAWQEREPGLAKEVQLLPLQRAASRQEVARAVLYLASDDAISMTGQFLIVDGGGVNTWYLSASERRQLRAERVWE
jgi:NAD(P)-dependent dehydrogenase (short-subunit alcohol dehydrogenase family)